MSAAGGPEDADGDGAGFEIDGEEGFEAEADPDGLEVEADPDGLEVEADPEGLEVEADPDGLGVEDDPEGFEVEGGEEPDFDGVEEADLEPEPEAEAVGEFAPSPRLALIETPTPISLTPVE